MRSYHPGDRAASQQVGIVELGRIIQAFRRQLLAELGEFVLLFRVEVPRVSRQWILCAHFSYLVAREVVRTRSLRQSHPSMQHLGGRAG